MFFSKCSKFIRLGSPVRIDLLLELVVLFKKGFQLRMKYFEFTARRSVVYTENIVCQSLFSISIFDDWISRKFIVRSSFLLKKSFGRGRSFKTCLSRSTSSFKRTSSKENGSNLPYVFCICVFSFEKLVGFICDSLCSKN